jgi:hypothetical protein
MSKVGHHDQRWGIGSKMRLPHLAVHTTEASNGSENVYTQRASAAWALDYSGTVDAGGTYHPSASNALTGPTTNKFTLVS